MKITREVNGETVEFELTTEERVAAYFEQQEQNDRDDMDLFIEEEWADDQEGFKERYGVEYSDAVESLDALGKRLRVHIEGYGTSWEDARYDALESWSGNTIYI